MTLGARIRLLRDKNQIERQQLADGIGITYHALSKYETDEREPDFGVLLKLADYFNTSTDYLLGRTDDPSPRPKIDTIAAHRTDDPMNELPEEARKSVEEFIDFVYKKYGKKEGEH
ncbi:helix-turn-helix domain-containing protein [Syntrophomonas curvata]